MGRSIPKIPCACCDGTGWTPMPDVFASTLGLLREQRGEINGAALAKLAGCKATAMNNRLVYLEGQGLAVGRRNGRERLWRAT